MPAKKIERRQENQKQKMVDFKTAVKRFWDKYFVFSGTATRSEYWWAVLFIVMVNAVIKLLGYVPFIGIIASMIALLWRLAIIVPCLSISTRRLHDAGFSAKWLAACVATLLIGFAMAMAAGMVHNVGMGHNVSVSLILLGQTALLISFALSIFILIVHLLPSKFKNNKYR